MAFWIVRFHIWLKVLHSWLMLGSSTSDEGFQCCEDGSVDWGYGSVAALLRFWVHLVTPPLGSA